MSGFCTHTLITRHVNRTPRQVTACLAVPFSVPTFVTARMSENCGSYENVFLYFLYKTYLKRV